MRASLWTRTSPYFATGILGLWAAAPAAGADPHQHGVGALNLAIQGNEVAIELESPGSDIVGFEHAPRTDAQKKAVQDAAKTLRDGTALFQFPAAAGCKLHEVEIESALLEHDGHHKDHGHKDHDHKKDAHKEHGEEEHAEFAAHYHFECEHVDRVTHIDLRYFEAFPAAQALEARTITASGQRAQRLTRDAARLKF